MNAGELCEPALAVTGEAGSLATGLDAGVLVIILDPISLTKHSRP
jgi:hypothetical protein